MNQKITAAVLTKNEGGNIEKCLESLSFCDEIIVVDDHSSDETIKIAKNYADRVIKRRLNDDFGAQRNFALSKAQNEWVLFVDADERISKSLALEIRKAVENTRFAGYLLKRSDVLWGRTIKYGEAGKIKLLRLAKKHSGRWERRVHETWVLRGETSTLKNPIIHYPHRNISEFIKHIDHFSSLHAKENLKEGKKPSAVKICLMPQAHFLRNYIFRLGFLDGLRGFLGAYIMSFHSFLAWSKMFLVKKNDN